MTWKLLTWIWPRDMDKEPPDNCDASRVVYCATDALTVTVMRDGAMLEAVQQRGRVSGEGVSFVPFKASEGQRFVILGRFESIVLREREEEPRRAARCVAVLADRGARWRCDACKISWDKDEPAPDTCEAIRARSKR